MVLKTASFFDYYSLDITYKQEKQYRVSEKKQNSCIWKWQTKSEKKQSALKFTHRCRECSLYEL